jgi:hypothetical protein
MVDCSKKLPPILVRLLYHQTAIFTQVVNSPIQTIAQEKDGEPNIPSHMYL